MCTILICAIMYAGKQSVERLDPLVRCVVPNSQLCNKLDYKCTFEKPLSFVWETTCEKNDRAIHQNAIVLNKLHNSQIIESKASFASLQLLISYPMLETRVASNSKIVEQWATKRWEMQASVDSTVRDWWVVKASQGNGGRDVWVFNYQNYQQVIQELPYHQEYVIQRYVNDPMLFRGKKFHFRCYSTMSATGMAMVYQKAFILSAGLDFDYNDDDVRKHITNLSINKRFDGHPGQVPCHLPTEYPEIYDKIQMMWSAVVEAALPYMIHQRSPLHFEFFGIDVIADGSGECWLIEANRLPGLESSKNNKQEEDNMYDVMMKSLLCIVLNPVIGDKELLGNLKGLWDVVRTGENSKATYNGESCWTNLLKWRAFTKASREKFLAEYALNNL